MCDRPLILFGLYEERKQKGPQDYPSVHKIQDEYSLRLFNRAALQKSENYLKVKGTAPVEHVAQMDGRMFFIKLNHLFSTDAPPPQQDEKMVRKMISFGLIPGSAVKAYSQLNKEAKQALETIQKGWNDSAFAINENGWLISRGNIGKYGRDYFLRAIIAYGGLGANLVEDAIYPVTRVDSDGQPLNGKNRYAVHFEKAPPVDAFWSITMYDDKQFFIENAINRYKLGSNDNLKVNPDGSIDIYIQNTSSGNEKEANWLPAPEGDFNLMMRLYGPKKEVIDGQWRPPYVKKI